MTIRDATPEERRLARMGRFGPWVYDERVGMVAVYPGEPRHCLDLPADAFVFVRHWARTPCGQGFLVGEDVCALGLLVAAAPVMRAALGIAAQALFRPASEEERAKAHALVCAALAVADGSHDHPEDDYNKRMHTIWRAAEEWTSLPYQGKEPHGP